MALTSIQRTLCRLIADNRVANGESYVAGGVALNELLGAPRVSRDVDLFHDTDEALASTWESDRRLLESSGYAVQVLRERPTFVEAEVKAGGEVCLVQWVRDSAYRFFPLVKHDDFGLTLHPFDLATNKVLALVGRVEVRDWVDAIECHDRLQPLGYLAWAACGKDPGFSPASILEHAAATTRYSAAEVEGLAFTGAAPDAATLSRRWHEMLSSARQLVARLPPARAGTCVLTSTGELCRAGADEVPALVTSESLVFHEGRIRGALPMLKGI
jgi:hypothetical protein